MRALPRLLLFLILASAAHAGTTEGLSPIGTSGKYQAILKSDREVVLFEHQGAGCLTHFWFGGNFDGVEDTRIRYYVDGEEKPSIDMQLYLGHGIGFNDNHAPWANRYAGKIGRRNGIFNNYRIPFGTGVKVTAQRSAKSAKDPAIWWIIRGVENLRPTLGGVELPATARLKLLRVEDQIVPPLQEFPLVDVPGKGAVFQVTIAAEGQDGPDKQLSYLEACMRAYTDGKDEPILLSSGLEDYFLGTYYFDTGRYHTDTAGLTHFDKPAARFSAYRYHDADPLFFQNGLRLTCRNGETEHGTREGRVAYKNPPITKYTTYAWVYQW